MFGGGGAQQVVIREEDEGDGGFLGGRDPRVFIVGRAEGERRAGFASAAVTGEDVLEWRRRRAWGLEVPWRVMVVRTWGRVVGGGRQGGEVVGAEGRRKRPGKKRRIELRGRRKKGAEAAERRRREGEEREAAEREKRTRRNREKKVKRKIKEKAKKAGVVDDAAELGEEGGDTMAGQSG
jgi:hypothetical protein